MAKEPHPQDCGVWFFFRVLALGIIACLLSPAVRVAAHAGLIGITRPARHHSMWRGSGKKAASTNGGAAFFDPGFLQQAANDSSNRAASTWGVEHLAGAECPASGAPGPYRRGVPGS